MALRTTIFGVEGDSGTHTLLLKLLDIAATASGKMLVTYEDGTRKELAASSITAEDNADDPSEKDTLFVWNFGSVFSLRGANDLEFEVTNGADVTTFPTELPILWDIRKDGN